MRVGVGHKRPVRPSVGVGWLWLNISFPSEDTEEMQCVDKPGEKGWMNEISFLTQIKSGQVENFTRLNKNQ